MKTIKIKKWKELPECFTGIVEWRGRDKFWYKDGKPHREDGPAEELEDGHKEWWLNDKRHRFDGPACEYADGTKEWWLEGKIYKQANLKDFIVLDSYQGKYNLTWYKILGKDGVFEYPDIPGLIEK